MALWNYAPLLCRELNITPEDLAFLWSDKGPIYIRWALRRQINFCVCLLEVMAAALGVQPADLLLISMWKKINSSFLPLASSQTLNVRSF